MEGLEFTLHFLDTSLNSVQASTPLLVTIVFWPGLHNKGQKMGTTTIKDRNCKDIMEAEETGNSWKQYTEELYKKGLNEPDNHSGVITYLEPDILEWEVKWALGIITTKLVEVTDFQLSYFKSQKMTLCKCCTQYARKFGKLSSSHRTGKGQLSFQSQRKVM